MENKSENAEATVVNTVVDEAVEKIDTTVAAAEEVVAIKEPAEEATILVPPTNEQEASSCDSTECNPYMHIGIIVIVAIVIIGALVAIIKSKKKNTANKGKKKSFKSNPNAVEIYVGNLSYEMGNSELRKEFEKFGIVTSARIITQRNSRKSKGYGFVEMPHRSEAEEAIRALNNKEIKGRKIHVNEARANTRPAGHK